MLWGGVQFKGMVEGGREADIRRTEKEVQNCIVVELE